VTSRDVSFDLLLVQTVKTATTRQLIETPHANVHIIIFAHYHRPYKSIFPFFVIYRITGLLETFKEGERKQEQNGFRTDSLWFHCTAFRVTPISNSTSVIFFRLKMLHCMRWLSSQRFARVYFSEQIRKLLIFAILSTCCLPFRPFGPQLGLQPWFSAFQASTVYFFTCKNASVSVLKCITPCKWMLMKRLLPLQWPARPATYGLLAKCT